MNQDDHDAPDAVRTPGRTWTEFPDELGDAGEGTVAVEAPDAVSVERGRTDDLYDQVPADRNVVTARHADVLEDDAVVHITVPRGVAVEEPVTITVDSSGGFVPHHVRVVVEDGVSARIVERNTGSATVHAALIEVEVGQDAVLEYVRLNALGEAAGYADAAARVGEDGTMRWRVVSTGADLYRNTVETELAGPRSTLDYRLGFLAADEQHMDHTGSVTHAADDTRCDMESRGVALDASRAVYKGVQAVEEGAEGTESFQNERTVLVGDEAEADTTPQLRIDNHDVEATHAATTGHVDEEDLFYMQSRGIAEAAAKRSIIEGMFDDLLSLDEARDVLRDRIETTLA